MSDTQRTRAPATLGSVRRAFAALERLADAPAGRGVTELARDLGVHKSSASRLLATMRDAGIVVADEASGRYGLGPGLLRLTARTWARLDVAAVSHNVLSDLAALSGETAYVSVRHGHSRVAVGEVESANPVRMVAGIGRPYPLYAGAPSKVLLAAMTADAVTTVMRDLPGARRGAAQRLRADLDRVRRTGYAMSVGENVEGATSVAVPIRGHAGAVVAALALAGVDPRWDRQRMLAIVPQLRSGAAEIERLLGRVAGQRPRTG